MIQPVIKIMRIFFVANERIYSPEDETEIDRARVSAADGSIIPIRRVSNELPQRILARSSI